MTIGFLLYAYPGIGGTETVSNLLADYFVSKGHDVCFLSWRRPASEQKSCFRVIYLPDEKDFNSAENNKFIEGFAKKHLDCLINQGPFWVPPPALKTSPCLIVSVLHYSPDFKIVSQRNSIIETFENRAGLKSVGKYVKATIRYWLKDYFSRRDFDRLYKGELDRQVSGSDRFVVLCDSYIAMLEKLMKCQHTNVRAIPNGIETDSRVAAHKEKLVVCAGRLTRWDKRVDRLLRIWSKVQGEFPDWNLLILGDGNDRKRLGNISESLDLKNCYFEGFVDVRPYLRKASILCMTSSSEGFPMVMLEAQSHGVVPIAYNISAGMECLIDNGVNGFLVQPFDERGYIRNLAGLMSDTRKRERISGNAVENARKFNAERMGQSYLHMIEEGVMEKRERHTVPSGLQYD